LPGGCAGTPVEQFSLEAVPWALPAQEMRAQTEERQMDAACVGGDEDRATGPELSLQELMEHPYWQPLDPALHALVEQVPTIIEKYERTTILSWIYLAQGVMPFVEVSDRIHGPESVTLRKKSLRRILRSMERLCLISIVNFPDEDGGTVDDGEDLIGRTSMISLNWTGMVWMRRAWGARSKMVKGNNVRAVHDLFTEEEDEGKGNDPCWVENLEGADPEAAREQIRQQHTRSSPITSVFDLALPRR
jgi:hypothetical protein